MLLLARHESRHEKIVCNTINKIIRAATTPIIIIDTENTNKVI